jgi:hypothetical protein
MLILCPDTTDREDEGHRFLLSEGCALSRFEEPGAGMVRSYWKRIF